MLGDDDVFILESIAEAKKNDEENLRVTLILSLKDNLLSISRIIKIIEVNENFYNETYSTVYLHVTQTLPLHFIRIIMAILHSSKQENQQDLTALTTTRLHR